MSGDFKPSPPKYWLIVTSKKNTKQITMAGAVFEGNFGKLRLRLKPGISLRWDDEVYIQLTPYKKDDAEETPPSVNEEQTGAGDDDDIPF